MVSTVVGINYKKTRKTYKKNETYFIKNKDELINYNE